MGELWLNNKKASDYGIISELIPSHSVPAINGGGTASIYGQSGDHMVPIVTVGSVTRTYSLFLKYDLNHEPMALKFDGFVKFDPASGPDYYDAYHDGNILLAPNADPVRLICDGYGAGTVIHYTAVYHGKVVKPNVSFGAAGYGIRFEVNSSGPTLKPLIGNVFDAMRVFNQFLGVPHGSPISIKDENLESRNRIGYFLGGTTATDVYGQGAKISVQFQINL